MLEVKNLVKVYETKGGEPVRAVDDVSIRFEERGMVFLLGKSGSGKSTLLNLCGGLDAPDEGEIVIKGRSSRDFSPADFDSYRNTFVGFVFQEYNILEEFTVEDNIALALELQSKGKDRTRVTEILRQVELEGYEKRKPNTLSGGQRQRVAIARALVKDPEIIMADEPTGALDSETGRQVLETLKKLSENKLVIVVSHDREFAEQFGDRIIELKDGKIVSDVTKHVRAAQDERNVRFLDDGTISVHSGRMLTADDLSAINRFLQTAEEDVLITSDKAAISAAGKNVPQATTTEFTVTDEGALPVREYSEEERSLIRSRLPLCHAVRIGASSMRVKPFRLIFTVLLCVIAFSMFGMFSTLTFFNRAETSLRTYRELGYEQLSLVNKYRTQTISYKNGKEHERWDNEYSTLFTDADLEKFRGQFGADVFAVFDYGRATAYDAANANLMRGSSTYYYDHGISGFAAIDPASSWAERLVTDTDLTALTADDVLISTYTFDSLKYFGMYTETNFFIPVELNDYDDIVGQPLIFQEFGRPDVRLTVRGVYRADLPEQYDDLLDPPDKLTPAFEQLANSLVLELEYGVYDIGFVSEDFFEAHREALQVTSDSYFTHNANYLALGHGYSVYATIGGEEQMLDTLFWSVNAWPPPTEAAMPSVIRPDGGEISTLKKGETIVPFSVIIEQLQPLAEEEYARKLASEGADAAEEWMQTLEKYANVLENGPREDDKTTQEDIAPALELFFSLLEAWEADYVPELTLKDPFGDGDIVLTIAGFTYGNSNFDGFYLSEEDFDHIFHASYADVEDDRYTQVSYTKYMRTADAVYERIVVPVPESNAALRSMLRGERQPDETDDTFYVVSTFVTYQIDAVSDIVGMLENIFLIVGVVMALFAMLLLFNFISVSISNKKREIGILRALGARSTDVFKIFFSEAVLIALICYVFSVVVCLVTCAVLNHVVATLLPVTLFIFGPLSWLVMLAIAALTSFVATFLPVRSAAKRKPVESIRAL